MQKNYFISFLIIISFFLGFALKEDVAGGGRLDLPTFYSNFLLIKNNTFFSIPWKDFISSGFPLHHLIVANVIFFSNDIFFLKLFTFLISIFCILIFSAILKLKYEVKENFNPSLILISVIPLLSPYFRTSAFWGLEENTCYFFFLVSVYFYLNKKFDYYKYLAIFFSICCVLVRQSFFFYPLFLFFYYINFSKIISKKNIMIILFYFIFSTPFFYFVYKFDGVTNVPIRLKLNLINIPIVMSFFFLYLLPFILVHLNYLIKTFIKKQWFLHLILFMVFYFFFNNKIDRISVYNSFGGGLIYKSIFNLNIFDIEYSFKIFLFLFFSYFGFIFLIFAAKKNIFTIFFFFASLCTYVIVSFIFQEYFDPLIFFFIILFTNFIKRNDLNKFSITIFIFYFFLLILSFVYRYYILPKSMLY